MNKVVDQDQQEKDIKKYQNIKASEYVTEKSSKWGPNATSQQRKLNYNVS